MSVHSRRKPRPQNSTSADIPLLEWVIASGGLAIVIAVVGVLIYEAVAGDRSPPDVKLTVQFVAPLQNGFLVKIHAENIGAESAERVSVTTEVWEESKVVQSSETPLDHLPPHSFREAGVFFQRGPRPSEIRLRALGYEEP